MVGRHGHCDFVGLREGAQLVRTAIYETPQACPVSPLPQESSAGEEGGAGLLKIKASPQVSLRGSVEPKTGEKEKGVGL